MAVPKLIADFETQLATSIAIGATSFSIVSILDDDGVTIPNGFYYLTVDKEQSNKEYFSCTVTGASVTSAKSVSRQGVETSGALRAHRVGASVTLTDWANYKSYIDQTAIAGVANATTTLQGAVELGTASEIDADTATGGTGAALTVTPDQLVLSKYYLRLPSASEKTSLPTLTSLAGVISSFVGRSAPTGWLMCDGSAVSRSTYATLLAIIAPSGTFTVTIASPGVLSKTAHGLVIGDKLHFTTTGGLPAGLSTNTDYFVISAGLTADAFEVSATRGGSAVVTTGSQSGTHTLYISNYGKGDGSTTFNVPDMRGMTPYGYKSSDANFDALNVPNTYVGEKTHTLITAELASHRHSLRRTAYITGGGGATSAGWTYTGSSGGSSDNTLYDDYNGQGQALSDTGSGTAHNNMSPYVITNFIIKT